MEVLDTIYRYMVCMVEAEIIAMLIFLGLMLAIAAFYGFIYLLAKATGDN